MSEASFFVEAPPEGGTTNRGFVLRTLRRQPVALAGLCFLVACTLMAILAPWIAPYPLHEQVGPVFGHPSWHHLLGLDDGGIDMVTLLIWGARISLVVGFAATFVSMVIGGTIGRRRRLLRRPAPTTCSCGSPTTSSSSPTSR